MPGKGQVFSVHLTWRSLYDHLPRQVMRESPVIKATSKAAKRFRYNHLNFPMFTFSLFCFRPGGIYVPSGETYK